MNEKQFVNRKLIILTFCSLKHQQTDGFLRCRRLSKVITTCVCMLGFMTGERRERSVSESSSEEKTWEQLMLRHHMHAYGTSKDSYLEENIAAEASTVEKEKKAGQNQSTSLRTPEQMSAMPSSPSPSLSPSPIAKSRRIVMVDRIVDSYFNSPSSSGKKKHEHGIKLNNNTTCNDIDKDDEQPESKLYDWHTSPLLHIALNGEEDPVMAGMDELLKRVKQV